ncbi:MAG TPA: radical SAM protein [Puia sp.]|jgi:hypothetical protein|nr:radical SAM protein [Puia sp.]
MRVAVIQVDGKLPNLALMQISSFHEKRGDSVCWYEGPLWGNSYDRVYASKIFGFSKMPVLPEHAVIGGTGIDFFNRLPEEMERCTPSYLLYPKCSYHLGFSMKGCRFGCKFCCVPKKEGRPTANSTIDNLLLNANGGNRLMLLDNDFFGGPEWQSNLRRIIELRLKVCFVQGINIRIITDEQAVLLAKSNYTNSQFNQKYLTFAWDRYHDEGLVKNGIRTCVNAGIPTKHMQFFVLIGFDTTKDQDYERVMMLNSLGCLPFVMPYNRNDPYQRAFALWVNNRAIFRSCTWRDYRYNRNFGE